MVCTTKGCEEAQNLMIPLWYSKVGSQQTMTFEPGLSLLILQTELEYS